MISVLPDLGLQKLMFHLCSLPKDSAIFLQSEKHWKAPTAAEHCDICPPLEIFLISFSL